MTVTKIRDDGSHRCVHCLKEAENRKEIDHEDWCLGQK